jgi:hypothetical protein
LEAANSMQYDEFLPLINKVLVDRIPPQWPNIDHQVRLNDREGPLWGPCCKMSTEELGMMKQWLQDNNTKGFIQPSWSPYGAPCLFAQKPDGGLQFCINYRDINSNTIESRYPIPHIQETLNLLAEARIYAKLDVSGGYYLVQVKGGD